MLYALCFVFLSNARLLLVAIVLSQMSTDMLASSDETVASDACRIPSGLLGKNYLGHYDKVTQYNRTRIRRNPPVLLTPPLTAA